MPLNPVVNRGMVQLQTQGQRAVGVFQSYLNFLQKYNKGLVATSDGRSQSTVKSIQVGILHWNWNATNSALWV